MAVKFQGGKAVPFNPNVRMARDNMRKAVNVTLYTLRQNAELPGLEDGVMPKERVKLAGVIKMLEDLSNDLETIIKGERQ